MRSARFRPRRFRGDSPFERLLILAILALAAGIAVGMALPQLSDSTAELTGRYAASGDAASTLSALRVVERPHPGAAYQRELFGFRETDEDGDGCDVRDEVLARDLDQVHGRYAGSCTVLSGVLHDPYTGQTIAFTRGSRTSAMVQIDHVVALENAWRSGASQWSTAQRYRFGNDPYNLLAVDGEVNEEKGSASAAYWLPPNGAHRCTYVARQIGVKAKYRLSVTVQERRAMLATLHSCPGQAVPAS